MIIFDLDGTLACPEHRRHFVDIRKRLCACGNDFSHICHKCMNWKPDYKAFNEACDKDLPIKPVMDIFYTVQDVYKIDYIQVWSGRCESVREKTEEWISKHCNYDDIKLKMRPIGNTEPDEVLKERWLDEAIAQGETVEFVFDDRPKVVRMYRRRGIFVFNCLQHDGEF